MQIYMHRRLLRVRAEPNHSPLRRSCPPLPLRARFRALLLLFHITRLLATALKIAMIYRAR